MKKIIVLICLCFIKLNGSSQSKSVLFIGNSYTGANNLPLLTSQLATSAGFSLTHSSQTPGGAQLINHISNSAVINSIYSNKWDYVVLQEQSQKPSFGHASVSANVYPYAKRLCDTIRMSDSCTQPIFYMTWGRKFGDASNCGTAPWLCTYDGMDSSLAVSYNSMGKQNDAFVSPVGAVWNYIIKNHPTINLYSSDNSHPSIAGSYAAASTFFSIIFRADPTRITSNSTLSASDALLIRNAVKIVCYDSLSKWNVGNFDPEASFGYSQFGSTIVFSDSSIKSTTYNWNFGDGNLSSILSPTHTYTTNGSFTVTLITEECGIFDTATSVINITSVSLNENVNNLFSIYPNPSDNGIFTIEFNSIGKSTVNVYSADGKIISSLVYSNRSNQVDLSGFNKGIYFIEIEVEGSRKIEKVIIY
ncbi:T9SS type A sorting domain-containing protein [Flavobacteriales bacterium]|nr:T9SS type A sorting domain-containing protein [Flavobacteriales bacterium]MDB4088338.1 T9SS type A sorting domain-containing protein [Flavobacteriales bacterium]